ncbi:MAG: LysE family transporter [Cytophagales bacterium]|nr:LysE family transporter [Cytophagales bacterium]MCA6366476.1 LysE family transporter [Cytophagales bacterium]MCA6374051.1 LysE family transporter [Cytophagales bacterium]MCA6376816.1 LysE family transporter [Cytophagales bacterium]MCA6383818.1 LysE family transporter [Cytophagales bacterium]
MEIVFNGVKFGFILAFLIGPVFFTIIQTSIERGFWNGAWVALGVSLSDAVYVAICYFGLFQFLNEPKFRTHMAYAGGAILILFGLYHLFVKTRKARLEVARPTNEPNTFKYFAKGFIINGISPMLLIFWIGTLSFATIDFGYSRGVEMFIFFVSLLITVLVTDVLKAFLADRLRALITRRFLLIMNVAVGICLIIFGVRLFLMAKTGL